MPQASARARSTQTSLCRPPNGHVPFHSRKVCKFGQFIDQTYTPEHLEPWVHERQQPFPLRNASSFVG